jgi:hypothetical protein
MSRMTDIKYLRSVRTSAEASRELNDRIVCELSPLTCIQLYNLLVKVALKETEDFLELNEASELATALWYLHETHYSTAKKEKAGKK